MYITQCERGNVMDAYETGRFLQKSGLIPGFNMTLECAVCKLCYLFGKGYSTSTIKEMISKSMKGELNRPPDWLKQNFSLIQKQNQAKQSATIEQIIKYCS